MSVAIVTGSAGLIGSEAAVYLVNQGFDVVGIDNDMRKMFFGDEASTAWNRARLETTVRNYRHVDADIRDADAMECLFRRHGKNITVIVHAAAQPSHDWASRDPLTDFTVNANGTLTLLEATRRQCPDAAFAFLSTNKVYGDAANRLPLRELKTRWEIDASHAYFEHGIDEGMNIDVSTHSLFGVSKAAADLLVQEYGRYFGMKTACFRGGCLTGPAHSGAELHGFLAYLMKCAIQGKPYTVFGYSGKQVRDNIHAYDLVTALWQFCRKPRIAEVYNIGGGRHSHCSMVEAITMCEELTSRPLNWSYSDVNRTGDHIWWVSDVRHFRSNYPDWNYTYDLNDILTELHDALSERYALS